MKDIVIWTGGQGDNDLLCEAVGRLPAVRVLPAQDASETQALMPRADALIMNNMRWNADFARVLASSPRLTWIQVLNAGFDSMEKLGVPDRVVVSTIGGFASTVVAEHGITLLLALVRHVPQAISAQHLAKWDRSLAPTATVRGMNIAVLGFGHIGRHIVALLTALGARPLVVASTERRDPSGMYVHGLEALHGVLSQATALVISAPLNDATRKVVNQAALAAMPPASYLVNISRGGIVDTPALVAALESGALAGAALDVIDPEPLPPSHPLWLHPNVLLTPHVGSAGTSEAEQVRLREFLVQNVRRFVNGEEVLYRAHLQRS
jgi:phosphoglycerate dehydrogenase-like enzyme